jgi:hypothetical protein
MGASYGNHTVAHAIKKPGVLLLNGGGKTVRKKIVEYFLGRCVEESSLY